MHGEELGKSFIARNFGHVVRDFIDHGGRCPRRREESLPIFDIEAREAGFLDALKKYPNIKLISADQHAGATRELAYQVSQNLLNRFKREVNGIFCPCEPPTIAMTKALRDVGLAGGKVKMIGFDAGSQSVTDMKNGDVQALVVQNPLLMGYLGVITAVKHLRGEKVERRIDTGVVLVTPENMEKPEIKDLLYPPIDKYLK